jgi:CRISPR-associated endoribonuclease Cas6
MRSVLEKLAFQVFEFVLEPEERIVFPNFKGNVFRGSLGKALRRLTCASGLNDCKDCLLINDCIYSRIFESFNIRVNQSILGKVEKAPHPFIIDVGEKNQLEYSRNQGIRFRLTLIGEAMKYISYFILAFIDIGEYGIGRTRGCFKIKEVRAGGQEIYNAHKKRITLDFDSIPGSRFSSLKWNKSSLNLSLETPLRLKYDQRFQKQITFPMIVSNLLRRVYLLANHYCGGPASVNMKELIDMSKKVVPVNSEIYWHRQERYSYRQNRGISMAGVSGTLDFEGDFSPFIGFLRIGEYLHLGKGTSFGLGKIKIY